MIQEEWKKCHNALQINSILFGFTMMVALSKGGIWASVFISVIIIFLSSTEVFFLQRLKKIDTIHWLGSNWILIASACAYIWVENIFLKCFCYWLMILCVYFNLYRTCYYEEFSITYLKHMIKDLPILCLCYIHTFFRKEEMVEDRLRKRNYLIGVLTLAVVLLFFVFPLYMSVDNGMVTVLSIVAGKFVYCLPVWLVCGLLGLIPAVLNYSIMQGLICDIVLQNPERNNLTNDIKCDENLSYYSVVVKIVLWGIAVVNFTLMGLQLSYLLHMQIYEGDMTLYHIEGALPLLIAVAGEILAVVLSAYLLSQKRGVRGLLFATVIYIISLVGLLLLLLGRYVYKIMQCGIDDFNVPGLIIIILLGGLLGIILRDVARGNSVTLKEFTVWGAIIFVVLSLFPVECIVSRINVSIFISRYNSQIMTDTVKAQDINLAFLEDMGYEAVPALIDLMDIPLIYETSNVSLGDTVKKMVIEMFYQDLSKEEREVIGELETEEQIKQFKNIIGDKLEYRVIGSKQIAFRSFYNYINSALK